MSVDHYENFPVASWLCPPALRGAVVAIYHFARTADDIADEGNATAAQRRGDLAHYRRALQAAADGQPLAGAWPAVFEPLASAITRHRLPVQLLDDLLGWIRTTNAPLPGQPNPGYQPQAAAKAIQNIRDHP